MDHESSTSKHYGASSWTSDRLRALTKTYATLEPKTRLRILSSFLHLPLRSLSELQTELQEFIKLGCNDSDPWIRSIANIVSNLPERGSLNETSLPDPNSLGAYKNLIATLTSKQASQLNLIPLEAMYLTRPTSSALFSSAVSTSASRLMSPQAPGAGANVPSLLPHHQLVKHFALRRKPKSAELRAHLVQKSTDLAGSSRLISSNSAVSASTMSTCPIKMRSFAKKMSVDISDTTSKGFDGFLPSSRMQTSSSFAMGGNRQHASAANSGVKVLELADLPSNVDPRKRHRASIAEAKNNEKIKLHLSGTLEEPPRPAFHDEERNEKDDIMTGPSEEKPKTNAVRKKKASDNAEKTLEKKLKKEEHHIIPDSPIAASEVKNEQPLISNEETIAAEMEARMASEMLANEMVADTRRLQTDSLVDFGDVPKLVSVMNSPQSLPTFRLAGPGGPASSYIMSANQQELQQEQQQLAQAHVQAMASAAGNLFNLFQQPIQSVPMRVVPVAFQDPNFPFKFGVQQASGQIALQQQVQQQQLQLQLQNHQQQFIFQQASQQSQQQSQQQPQSQQAQVVFTAQGPVFIPR